MNQRDDILPLLATVSIDTLIGRWVEDYCDFFGIDDELLQLLRRFLSSAPRTNREIVIDTFCRAGAHWAAGLEADTLVLHLQSLDADDTIAISAARHLHDMANMGSGTALRMLSLLRLDDAWMQSFGFLLTEQA